MTAHSAAFRTEVHEQLAKIGQADIVVGIPSYNSAKTIGHVVRAVQAGLTKYFPDCKAVLVNSDGGSSDGTVDVVHNTAIEDFSAILLRHRTELEVGSLAEVYRNYSPRRVCQVDIASTYEHKHQALAVADVGKGLMKMAVDICKSIFRTLAAEGVVFSDGFFNSLFVSYLRQAEDTIMKYEADAMINGLAFDLHEETKSVEAFTQAISIAAQTFTANSMGAAPLIPNWNRVSAAIPDILEMLKMAVDEDNK